VRRRFGPEVAELVEVMSEDERIEDFQPRKQEHRARIRRAGRIAAAIFAADKLVKAREIQGSAATVPEEKFEHYQRTLSELRDQYPELPLPGWSASFR
jgi:hypothetical protein